MAERYNDILRKLEKKGVLIEGWLEHLPEILHKYIDEGETAESLCQEYKVAPSTFFFWLKKLGISKPKELRSKAEEVVKNAEERALKDEAEKLTMEALTIGGVIARRYQPLIDHMLSRDRSLESIAEEIMEWFEEKPTVKKQLEALEAENGNLQDKLSEAWGIAAPNFRYLLRTKLLDEYALRVLRLRALGVDIDAQETIKGFQKELKLLDDDFWSSLEVRVENEQRTSDATARQS
jgi:hypothetical protein